MEYPVLLGHSWFYWGSFGWLAIPIHRYFVYILWAVMGLAFASVLKYFWQTAKSFGALPKQEKTAFYQTIFLIFCVLGFFLMIHTVNFQQVNPRNVADESHSIAIQGRYFFPVMAAKFYLIFLGLSFLLSRPSWRAVAWFLFSFMLVLNLAGLFVYVIPRYYF